MSEEKSRAEMISEIEWYCEQIGIGYPKGFPDEMTNEEMAEWIEVWDEYDPCPDI